MVVRLLTAGKRHIAHCIRPLAAEALPGIVSSHWVLRLLSLRHSAGQDLPQPFASWWVGVV